MCSDPVTLGGGMTSEKTRPAPRQKTKIYYDGQCAMCTAIMGHVRASDQRGAFLQIGRRQQIADREPLVRAMRRQEPGA